MSRAYPASCKNYLLVALFALFAWDITQNEGQLIGVLKAHVDHLGLNIKVSSWPFADVNVEPVHFRSQEKSPPSSTATRGNPDVVHRARRS